MAATPLNTGLAVIHANQLEQLRALVVDWMRAHPLAPLENEVVLVQSNGISQWLKLALAEDDGLGISAALEVQLPGRFLWQAYRAVLGEDEVPAQSPFDKAPLSWRLFRLLPDCLEDEAFAPLRRFLEDDSDLRKRHQLAERLADLFDQYQVYRADWLEDWAAGRDQLRDAHGEPAPLAEAQRWQAELWRRLRADLPEAERDNSRAALHRVFLRALEQHPARPARLPRRVIVFGISSLPQQMLEALAAIARHSQVLLCVHNPCRHYWADIIEHRELLRAEQRRQSAKPGMPALLEDDQLHLHANPLLAAWGKQGRDYIRLLDAFDDTSAYRDWFNRIDLFEDYGHSLLEQVQQAILDLEPPPAPEQRQPVAASDDSIAFHIAHSPQREVEILHDQLLALLEGNALAPRDIIVMVPDVDRYAPHIRAVFGQLEPGHPRYIPYSLADQRSRGRAPLLIALEHLLQLPEARWPVSALLDLLEVPALRARTGLRESELPTLHRWIEGAGIRWGLSAEQRQQLGLPGGLEQNTWRFGLRRMLLGYAVGASAPGAVGAPEPSVVNDDSPWAEIEPYDEVGGLDAALVGPLAELLDQLEHYSRLLSEALAPAQWVQRLRQLLEDFFQPADEGDTLLIEQLQNGLEHWLEQCQQAGLSEPLPLTVVREAWLNSIDEASLSQRFLAGSVNFCTLMPMRAIPFQVVCLLGMNDGDYPRSQAPLGFDLMAGSRGYRPGDRSRREDDRYLFLEALLSARQKLYLSWIGRSVQDNSERPPSLLVAQLRDYLASGWCREDGQALLHALTLEHPLQPFSARYFEPAEAPGHDPRLYTYAESWRQAHQASAPAGPDAALPRLQREAPLSLAELARFLKSPAQAFFNERLKVWFEDEQHSSEDLEPFAFDHLQQYQLSDELLRIGLRADDPEQAIDEQLQRLRRRGALPLGAFAQRAADDLASPARASARRALAALSAWPHSAEPQAIALAFTLPDGSLLPLEDSLNALRHNDAGEALLLHASPQPYHKGKALKYHRLLRPWLQHLAGCASGLRLHTLLTSPSEQLSLAPLGSAQAQSHLQAIVEAWWAGMQQPLPLASKTAFAWLEGKAEAKAREAFEGGFSSPGERQQDAYLARAWPRFEQMFGSAFEHWAERLYQPLRQQFQPEDAA